MSEGTRESTRKFLDNLSNAMQQVISGIELADYHVALKAAREARSRVLVARMGQDVYGHSGQSLNIVR